MRPCVKQGVPVETDRFHRVAFLSLSSGGRQETQRFPLYSSQLWPVYACQKGCSSTNSPAALVHKTIEAPASHTASKRRLIKSENGTLIAPTERISVRRCSGILRFLYV